MSLDKNAVIAAAMAILDEYGFADLSMRRIADAVGVKAGAIYWHFANKQTLLAAVSDEILRPVAENSPANLESWGRDLRAQLLAHRDAGELVSSTMAVGLGTIDPGEHANQLLRQQGFPEDQATQIAGAMVHLILGHVVEEQSRRQLIELGVLKAPAVALDESGFDTGLQVLLAGIAAISQDFA